jgi:putative membrane protein
MLLSGGAMAQPSVQTTTEPGVVAAPGAMNHNGMTGTAENDANGAINTAGSNSPLPASGANSFTRSQAISRIADHGYKDVNLQPKKDQNGIWHGTADRNGQPVNVWLDYKGNVGQK